jgi:2-keto-4-pentenoate hydratase/2-oxohepta-3-ene-1,7-dioic acid hydratase in catechol pathway
MKTINFNNQQIIPNKIICIGRNYVEHILELNNETPDSMVVFNKSNNAITNELYFISEATRFEGEICFLIKDKKINGIGFGLDLTKADIQNKMKQKGLPWERAKSFDNSAVFSDFVSFSGDIKNIKMQLFINDELTQEATYDLMIYKPDKMLEEINTFMTLQDNDIIMSGTPKGVNTYKKDDKFEAKIFSNDTVLINKTWIVTN